MHTYILEADTITGPWRMVTYMRNFGEHAYFVNIPSKFISPDGRTFWLCYSANFCDGYNGEAPLKANPPGSGCPDVAVTDKSAKTRTKRSKN
jgi:hypothetical protein